MLFARSKGGNIEFQGQNDRSAFSETLSYTKRAVIRGLCSKRPCCHHEDHARVQSPWVCSIASGLLWSARQVA